MNLELFILGIGGSMPLPNRSLTSMVVRREGEMFLFDCGEGTQVSLRKAGLRWKKLNAIFVTHTHADHVTGLPGMLMLSSQVDRTEPLYVIGPPRIQEYIDANRSILEMYINFEIVVKEIPPDNLSQVVWEADGYHVRSFPVKHSRICVGYVLEEDKRPGVFQMNQAREMGVPMGPLWAQLQAGESVTLAGGRIVHSCEVMGKSRPGRKITFVTDTLPIDTLAGEVYNSDVLICEGMFSGDAKQTAREKKHMTVVDAALIAKKAGGVRKMGLIHFSPRYTNAQLKHLVQEAREVFPQVVSLKERMMISVSYLDEE